MQIHGQSTSVSFGGAAGGSAFALSLDIASIVQKVNSVKEARALPRGSVIGDIHGGLTFTDAVAYALESRSAGGWQEWKSADGNIWTIIILNR
jgi:hypothetical protein